MSPSTPSKAEEGPVQESVTPSPRTGLRVLAISELFPSENDKSRGVFVSRLLREMARFDAQVTVIVPVVWCPRWLRTFERWQRYDHTEPLRPPPGVLAVKVPCVRPPGNWFNRWWGQILYLLVRRGLRRQHASEKFDLIYGVGVFPAGDTAVRLAKYLDLPCASMGIGSDVNVTARSTKVLSRHFAQIVRDMDGWIACGASIAEQVDRVTGSKSLVHTGVVDLKEFSPASPQEKWEHRRSLGLPEEKIILLYVGHLIVTKGVYELIAAMATLRTQVPSVLLVMCGHGAEEPNLRQVIKAQYLGSVVHLAGDIPPDEICRWMKASDLFVLPSYSEGMPNAVMEAMGCGLPSIVTAVGGLPAALKDCDGAVLVPPKDSSALAAAMLEVVGETGKRAKMGIAARRKAESDFSVESTAHGTLDYFKRIVNKKKLTHSGEK